MSDRLLVGTSRKCAVMKAGKSCFRKGKEKQVGDCGGGKTTLLLGDSFLKYFVTKNKVTILVDANYV